MAGLHVVNGSGDGKKETDTLGLSIEAGEMAGALRLLSTYVADHREADQEGMRCILDMLASKACTLAEHLDS